LKKIAEWQRLKALVLDSVSSPITKRVYNMALDEFMSWFQQAPRPGFTKATVSAWRASLDARLLGASSIIIRMSVIRKLAAEAADNGLLAPELAAGISRVKSAKPTGIRVGNWLSVRQAQSLLNAPDITTVGGLRDRAILAVLLGCGLRRSEAAGLTLTHLVCFRQACVRPLESRFLLGQDAADGGSGDLELACDLRFADSLTVERAGFHGFVNRRRWTAETFALLACVIQAGANTLAKDLAFELGEYGEQASHGATCWGGQIKGCSQRYEADSEVLQFLERRNQIRDGPAPAIQAPHQHDIDFTSSCGSE
jgi:hypothetical protein